ncbi:hypothetical protein DITRI_Ditri09bG0088000 [Diplodiscus trichospermus]
MSDSVASTMNKLRQAAQAGDIYELYNALLEEEEDVLSRIDEAEHVETPLHIAASRGHADFAKAIMYLKPSCGRKLDRNICSPMQLALQNGHREVVLDLLAVDKDLVRVKGREGYSALHYAAEKGDIDILAQFLKACPACVEDVTIRNETALHLAVKCNKLAAVEILARYLRRTRLYCKVPKCHLLNFKDRNGNTALHIAASNTQPQMIQVLIECQVGRKETNNEGFSALDLLERQSSETDNRESCINIMREAPKERSVMVRQFLLLSGLGKEVIVYLKNVLLKHEKEVEASLSEMLRSKITKKEESLMLQMRTIIIMSTEKINALLVVVTLILTATYQAMLSPPGGVWQGDYPENSTSEANNHVGESVMDSSFVSIFYVLNFEVFFFASCLTLAFLHAVTKSGILIVVFEILLSSLMWSLVDVQQVIEPKSGAALVKSHPLIAQVLAALSFFALFLGLDFLRRQYTPPYIRFFLEFFHQNM